MLVPWFNYNACSITRDSQGKRVQFARQHAKVRDFTSRHACLEVKFGFRQVQVCFIGGSLPVILSLLVVIYSCVEITIVPMLTILYAGNNSHFLVFLRVTIQYVSFIYLKICNPGISI